MKLTIIYPNVPFWRAEMSYLAAVNNTKQKGVAEISGEEAKNVLTFFRHYRDTGDTQFLAVSQQLNILQRSCAFIHNLEDIGAKALDTWLYRLNSSIDQ